MSVQIEKKLHVKLRNHVVHCRFHRGLSLVNIRSQRNQAYNVVTYEIRSSWNLTLTQNATWEPGQESQYSDSLQTGRYRVRIPVGRDFVFSQKRPHELWGPPSYVLNGHRGPFPRVKRLRREVEHSPPLMTMLRKRGAMPLPPLYASKARTGTALRFYKIRRNLILKIWAGINK